jgi:hypothetical protein
MIYTAEDVRRVLGGPAKGVTLSAQPVVLYGREWSAEDAAYAKQLQDDRTLSAVDITRLWAREPAKCAGGPRHGKSAPVTINGQSVTEIGGTVTENQRGRPRSEKSASDAERARAYRERKRAKD